METKERLNAILETFDTKKATDNEATFKFKFEPQFKKLVKDFENETKVKTYAKDWLKKIEQIFDKFDDYGFGVEPKKKRKTTLG